MRIGRIEIMYPWVLTLILLLVALLVGVTGFALVVLYYDPTVSWIVKVLAFTLSGWAVGVGVKEFRDFGSRYIRIIKRRRS